MPFELFARLGLDQRAFAAGLTQARGKVSQFAGSVRGQIAAAFGTASITALMRKTIQYASTMQDLSDATGQSAETLQEWDHAAKQTGSSVEAMVKAAKALANARKEAIANPTGPEAKAFQKFGIDPRSTSDPTQLMQRLSASVKGVAMDLDTIPVLLELIGSRGMEVIPALVAGLADLGEEARRLGLVLANDVVRQLDQIGDSVDVLAKRLTISLGPAMAATGNKALDLLDKMEAGWTGLFVLWSHLKDNMDTPGVGGVIMKGLEKAAGAIEQTEEEQKAEKAAIAAAVEARKNRPRLTAEDLEDIFSKSRGGNQPKTAGSRGDPLVADSLARIGGFGASANNIGLKLQERIAAAAEQTARHTADIARSEF